MAQRAKEKGFAWLALELDDFGNDRRWPEFAQACRGVGIKPGVWFTNGGSIYLTPDDAEFAIAEHEGRADHEGILDAVRQGRLPSCPLAIATNFDAFYNRELRRDDPELAKPIIEAGFACLTEAYLGDNPLATPEALDTRARWLGFRRTAPIFGVWNKRLADYAPWFGWPGWSVFPLENALE